MRVVMFILIASIAILLVGCATLKKSIPVQLPQTIREGAATYERVRPEVIQARETIKANWASLSPDLQKLATDIDKILPELDTAGKDLVLARDFLDALDKGQAAGGGGGVGAALKSVDWDTVLSVVLKAAGTAAQLKSQGVI